MTPHESATYASASRRRRTTLLARLAAGMALVLMPILAACAGGGNHSQDPNEPGRALQNRQFVSTSVTGHELIEGTAVALSFTSETVSASAGCNSMSADASWDGDSLGIDAMAMTEMGCDPARHGQDEWLLGFLTSTPRFALDGTTLTVTGDKGTIEFAEVLPEPIDAGEWVLDGIITGDAVASVPADVRAGISFAENEVRYQLGCNSGGAIVEIHPSGEPGIGSMTFEDAHATLMACDETTMDIESHLSALYAGTIDYAITGSRLTIMGENIGATYQLRR